MRHHPFDTRSPDIHVDYRVAIPPVLSFVRPAICAAATEARNFSTACACIVQGSVVMKFRTMAWPGLAGSRMGMAWPDHRPSGPQMAGLIMARLAWPWPKIDLDLDPVPRRRGPAPTSIAGAKWLLHAILSTWSFATDAIRSISTAVFSVSASGARSRQFPKPHLSGHKF